eukprot:TRINITY_DN1977_c0_g1_i2.p1 TRINITY_DN1977_c0_g1~~TRINITY_DN1977_c0_g1_i2.p1  ORF type:complete len:115 (-),score=4.54 TRINITY_DN1977_c0_g1_i2:65-409(-)
MQFFNLSAVMGSLLSVLILLSYIHTYLPISQNTYKSPRKQVPKEEEVSRKRVEVFKTGKRHSSSESTGRPKTARWHALPQTRISWSKIGKRLQDSDSREEDCMRKIVTEIGENE